MRSRPIRLLLFDDHPASREPLAMLLDRQPDLTVVGQVGSLAEARSMVTSGLAFDIAIVDLDLGDGNGVAIIRDLCRRHSDAEVLVLTGMVDERMHGRAILEGASGIVPKTAATVEVIAAIRKLAAGESIMPPAEAASLVERGRQHQHEEEAVRHALKELSPREREVLRALAAGLSNEAIAAQLCVSQETVRSHVVRILRKLGASSRLQAAIIAIHHGWGDDSR